MHELLTLLARERPVGSETNAQLLTLLEERLGELGYALSSLPFDCLLWEWGPSTLELGGLRLSVEPGPYSLPFSGRRPLLRAQTLGELEALNCRDAILLLSGELCAEAISPKDYPFYYPDEHRALHALLQEKAPAAILAATGDTPLSGKNPFPLFEDGNFDIPNANLTQDALQRIEGALSAGELEAALTLDSRRRKGHSRQLVATRRVPGAKGRVVLAAHLDSKYDTPGALDNAAGVAVLLEAAQRLRAAEFDLDIVPFNTEECYAPAGELAYMELLGEEQPSLLVNIDSPCHVGSRTALSFYNFGEASQAVADGVLAGRPTVEAGAQWYAGDHVPFVFRGVPCVAVASGDLFEGALSRTHTPADTLDTVDAALIEPAAQALAQLVEALMAGAGDTEG